MEYTTPQLQQLLSHFPLPGTTPFDRSGLALMVLHEALVEEAERRSQSDKRQQISERVAPGRREVVLQILEHKGLWDCALREARWSAPLMVMALKAERTDLLMKILDDGHHRDDMTDAAWGKQLEHLFDLGSVKHYQSDQCVEALFYKMLPFLPTSSERVDAALRLPQNAIYRGMTALFLGGFLDDTGQGDCVVHLAANRGIDWPKKLEQLIQWQALGLNINANNRLGLHILLVDAAPSFDDGVLYELLKMGVSANALASHATTTVRERLDAMPVRRELCQMLERAETKIVLENAVLPDVLPAMPRKL